MNELNDKQINFLLGILKGVQVGGTREQVAVVSAEIEAVEVVLRKELLSRQEAVLNRKLEPVPTQRPVTIGKKHKK